MASSGKPKAMKPFAWEDGGPCSPPDRKLATLIMFFGPREPRALTFLRNSFGHSSGRSSDWSSLGRR
eukprot:4795819-Pleurochrysis_carterae.AAC.1